MKSIYTIFFALILFSSCTHNSHITYLNDLTKNSLNKIQYFEKNKIKIGDILKIDIITSIPEASNPYNQKQNDLVNKSTENLVIDGYSVNKNYKIIFPILGEISVLDLTENELALKIKNLLISNGHLTNPYVRVKIINSKFTVLGEVRNPGTFSFYDQLNIFQALGLAGDLLITAKRKNILLIREENGLRKTYKFSLTDSSLLEMPFYFIKNNDIIIVKPNYSKVKSAGFIGSPASIASISSLVLSITLLLINSNN